MSSHFLFHSDASETVPAEARYAFPTQASRVIKSVTKIPPRSGVDMRSLDASSKGRLIQFTLPAQGYMNPLESYLRFDLKLNLSAVTGVCGVRTVNNIHTMFRRLRVVYGSLVIEDIQNYGTLVRMLSNVAVGEDYQNRAGAITEGMGSDARRAGLFNLSNPASGGSKAGDATTAGVVNYQAAKGDVYGVWGTGDPSSAGNFTVTGSAVQTRTFTLNLASGLLTQQKLIPLKWLANQLTIELEVESPEAFCVQGFTAAANQLNDSSAVAAFSGSFIPRAYIQTNKALTGGADGVNPTDGSVTITYDLTNIYFNAEILEFDSTYDAAFYQGMLQGGIPLKFASWHGHQHALQNANTQVLTIQERSRSIKSAFSVIRDRNDISAGTYRTDPYWFHAATAEMNSTTEALQTGSWIDEFQWRVGGRYFPSQPVKCNRGGAEPLIELQKALNVIGDYSVGSLINAENWWNYRGTAVISAEFESTNGNEMSGVNAEELADLALVIKYASGSASAAPTSTSTLYTFIHYDALLIVRPNNVVELVQ